MIFNSGISYQWIMAINILLTIPVWIRTLFLFPEGHFIYKSDIFPSTFFGTVIIKIFTVKNASRQTASLQIKQNRRFREKSARPWSRAPRINWEVVFLFQRRHLFGNGSLDNNSEHLYPLLSVHVECLCENGRGRRLSKTRGQLWQHRMDTSGVRPRLRPDFRSVDKMFQKQVAGFWKNFGR